MNRRNFVKALTLSASIAAIGLPAGTHAADTIGALREAGIETLVIAGRARELGEDADQVDAEAYDGVDVVALLDDLLTRLGAPAGKDA